MFVFLTGCSKFSWGDTPITPGDEYSVWTDAEILLNRNGTLNEEQLTISNNTVQESCLWGVLKK